MGQMDFYRRSRLAGNNLPRLYFATIRGSIRRSDPDGTSTVPYFPGFPSTPASLLVSVDGGAPVTATINGPGILDILTALNTAFQQTPPHPPMARAYDDDGCISIQTTTRGSSGSMAVVGGSAAAALGFSTGLGLARSTGGDIESGPEARLKNGFGTAFPSKGENLSTKSFVKALGRIAGNTDVLYSELARVGMKLAKVDTVSSQTVLTATSALVTVTGSLYTGYGVLGRSAAPEDLAPFFFLIDSVTKGPALSRVTAVVRGTVSGDPPYADAPDLNTAGNVLGKSLLRTGPVAIEGITEGRILYSSTGNFNQAQVGDLVRIDGADNAVSTAPWDNRGLRWVVEALSQDGTECAVRPMSKAELALYGTTTSEEQPILELNAEKAIGQSYGTATFFTGSFLSPVKLVVSPPMPPGASYEVWAGVPASFRDQIGSEHVTEHTPLYRALSSTQDPVPNAILSRPSLAIVLGKLRVGQFLARLHGRVISIPQGDLTGSGVAVWDEADGLPKIVASVALTQHIIATGVTAGSFTPACRIDAGRVRTATVGSRGQFADLASALAYYTQWATDVGEVLELQVLETQTAPTGGWSVTIPNVRVRGAVPEVALNHGASGPLFNVPLATVFVLEDFVVDLSKTIVSGTSSNIAVRGLYTPTGASPRQRRSLDSLNDAIDIGHDATSVLLGKSGATVQTRGSVTANEGVVVPDTATVQVGTPGTGGHGAASLSSDGTQGQVILSKNGETDVALTKDQVDVLRGGTSSNADGLHRHAASAVAVGSTSALRTGFDVQSQLEELDAGKQANLGFTPVQQGGGIGQFGNRVQLGWDSTHLKATIDGTTDIGQLAMVTELRNAGVGSYGVLGSDQWNTAGGPFTLGSVTILCPYTTSMVWWFVTGQWKLGGDNGDVYLYAVVQGGSWYTTAYQHVPNDGAYHAVTFFGLARANSYSGALSLTFQYTLGGNGYFQAGTSFGAVVG